MAFNPGKILKLQVGPQNFQIEMDNSITSMFFLRWETPHSQAYYSLILTAFAQAIPVTIEVNGPIKAQNEIAGVEGNRTGHLKT